jgi:hypothetical protein
MKTWPGGIDIEVRQIRPSHLDEWLALHEARLKNTSYNRYAGLVKQLFEIAVKDRIIAESPFEQVTTRWKKPQEPIRCVPTIEQFQAIVDEIRAQRYTRFAAPTADFVEFLGLAGVGQAEAASLTWGDVDWQNERISFRRHKTDADSMFRFIRICGLARTAEKGRPYHWRVTLLCFTSRREEGAQSCVRAARASQLFAAQHSANV